MSSSLTSLSSPCPCLATSRLTTASGSLTNLSSPYPCFIEDAQKAADNSKLINNINQKQVNPVNLVNSHSSRKHQPYTCQRRNFVSSILA